MKNFDHLIDPNIYQVFVLACHARIPVSFARHMWFVVNKKGVVDRWEVLIEKNRNGNIWDHLHKNAQAPFKPLGAFTNAGIPLWYTELLGVSEGNEDSVAYRLIQFIEKTPEIYKNSHYYLLLGPNSNTYVQWVLDHFPEFKVKMPWNAFGKEYKVV